MAVAVKICGLKQMEDVEVAINAGADALGFVFDPRSPRFVGEDPGIVRELTRNWPLTVKTVAVFGRYRVGLDARSDYAQAHDFEQTPQAQALAVLRPLPDKRLEDQIEEAKRWNPAAIVLDAYSPTQSGGTGLRVDVEFAVRARELSPWPVILAGGLRPDNVAQAIREIRPYAVDVSSGVEASPGVKDHDLIKRFVEEAKLAG